MGSNSARLYCYRALGQWLFNKYRNSSQVNTRIFSLLEFSLSYNQIFFASCIGYDISGDGDGNPTIENTNATKVIFHATNNAMLFILCI